MERDKQIVELDLPLELFMDLQIGEEELRARVMVSALSFLLGYEHVDDDDDDSEASSDEDDEYIQNPQIVLSREVVYKALEPLLRQIVNQFVRDHSRPEAIAVGLNVVCEMCLRMPLLMNEDLLQDLVLYKKSHEKAVSIAARSLITLLRETEVVPLIQKARPKQLGEVNVANDVPDVELLKQDDDKPLYSRSEDEMAAYGSEAANDSLPVDSDICARVAYEEDEDSVENDGEFFPGSGQSSDIDGLEDDAYRE
ncbi:hypothetical protein HPP92_026710 [Vanilla planifolia]|uniref:Protein SDA1 n=1 Tax=Vanilla planifolia TaxID=51239 RepID=A0A835PE48_VANPL|nr:hypothetical protein HPP92_026710 [Vanilla planifolia]